MKRVAMFRVLRYCDRSNNPLNITLTNPIDPATYVYPHRYIYIFIYIHTPTYIYSLYIYIIYIG